MKGLYRPGVREGSLEVGAQRVSRLLVTYIFSVHTTIILERNHGDSEHFLALFLEVSIDQYYHLKCQFLTNMLLTQKHVL